VRAAVIAFTHVGKVRSGNEDALHVSGRSIQGSEELLENIVDSDDVLLMVADGMGGHERGELASMIVLDSISKILDPYRGHCVDSVLEAISWASENIRLQAVRDPEAASMGSTIVGLWLRGNNGIVFNVGDSRAYVYENERLQKLTKDHSQISEKVDSAEITEEEARTSSDRSQLTSAITGYIDPIEKGYFASDIHVDSNAIYLLCSDGLWETMSMQDMAGVFADSKNLSDLSNRLKNKALSTEAKDNLSFILVRTEP